MAVGKAFLDSIVTAATDRNAPKEHIRTLFTMVASFLFQDPQKSLEVDPSVWNGARAIAVKIGRPEASQIFRAVALGLATPHHPLEVAEQTVDRLALQL